MHFLTTFIGGVFPERQEVKKVNCSKCKDLRYYLERMVVGL